MESKSKAKHGFVLDCCNKNESTLRTYNSQQDIYLAGYFALQKKRNLKFGSKTLRSKDTNASSRHGPSVYLQSPITLKQSLSSNSIRHKNHEVDYLSSSKFKDLIHKHRLAL